MADTYKTKSSTIRVIKCVTASTVTISGVPTNFVVGDYFLVDSGDTVIGKITAAQLAAGYDYSPPAWSSSYS